MESAKSGKKCAAERTFFATRAKGRYDAPHICRLKAFLDSVYREALVLWINPHRTRSLNYYKHGAKTVSYCNGWPNWFLTS